MLCQDIRSTLLGWFGDGLECHQRSSDSLVVVLPFTKPNGDAIELGVRSEKSSWFISDLGDTHESLYLAGIDIREESDRRDEFVSILSDHGITDVGNELSFISKKDLAEDVFDFASAINSILALQLTISTKPPLRDFSSVVAKFLAEQKASFEIPVDKTPGKAGSWKFNFSLNHVHPETMVKTLTASNSTLAMKSAQTSVFEVSDVREIRKEFSAVMILDDEGERRDLWKPHIMRIFDGYEVPAIPFNRGREQLMSLVEKYSLGKH
jgi:hypothetical protein